VSAPAAPELVGVAGVRGAPGQPTVHGDTVFVASFFSDIPTADPADVMDTTVFDGSDPTSPTALTKIEPPGGIIAMHGSVGYQITGDAIRPVELEDPSAPVFAAPVDVPTSILDALVADDRLFLAGYEDLVVVDLSEPLAPRVAEVLPYTGLALARDGRCLYLAEPDEWEQRSTIVHVFDIGPRHPNPVRHVSDLVIEGANPAVGIQGMAAANGALYVTALELYVMALGRTIPTATAMATPPALPTPSPLPTASPTPTHVNLPTATPSLTPRSTSTAEATGTEPPAEAPARILLPVGWR
jgi:hypothetical protein